jgi:hypothetical protein
VIRFLRGPTSRSYVVNYAAGRDLCRSYVAGDPGRLRRLLTEQARVRDLLDAGAAGDAGVPPGARGHGATGRDGR